MTRRGGDAVGPRGRGGFTLIELILVLLIVGLLVAVSAPSLGGLRRRTRLEGTGRALAAVLNEGRRRAIEEGRAYRVLLDPAAGRCRLEALTPVGFERPATSAGRVVELDEGVSIERDGAAVERPGALVRFESDGRHGQVVLRLADAGGGARVVWSPTVVEPFRVDRPGDVRRYSEGGFDVP